MDTFKSYLESGNFAIVSCKDRKNPNFQIWGAMSDLGCGKKKRGKGFREWASTKLNEELTLQQNKAIKNLYVIIRDVLIDLKIQMASYGFEEFDHEKGPGQWVSFCAKFRSLYKPAKDVVSWAQSGCGIELRIPEFVKQTFPNIRIPFYLRFPYEEDEIGGLGLYHDKTTDELRINLKHFLSNFDQYKNTLQHELQHLVNSGSSPNHSQDNLLLRTLEYLSHPGEIAAFAKEFARRYHKLFPNDSELDFVKFKKSFYKNGSLGPTGVILNNYINFGEDTEGALTRWGLTGDANVKNQLQDCYNNFTRELKRSFYYFKQQL